MWKRLRAAMHRLQARGPEFDFHAANGAIFDIGDLTIPNRQANDLMIRSLCRNAYLGDGVALAQVLGRYKMFVDTRDAGLSPHLLIGGYWELWHTEAMVERVKPEMKAVDAGANLGYFTLLLAELVGPTGSVHAFEPNPRMARLLRNSLEINGFYSRTTVHEVALSDADGVATFWASEDQPKNGQIVGALGRPGEIAVDLRRLDSFDDLLDVDFIKIDVEGAEEKLWSGMAGLLAKGRPLTVFLEFTAGRYKDPGAFIDRLTAGGFEMGLIDHRAGIVPLDRATLLACPPREDQLVVLVR